MNFNYCMIVVKIRLYVITLILSEYYPFYRSLSKLDELDRQDHVHSQTCWLCQSQQPFSLVQCTGRRPLFGLCRLEITVQ